MDASHLISDLQSLRLTQAAVDVLVRQPELIAAVIRTLEPWGELADMIDGAIGELSQSCGARQP